MWRLIFRSSFCRSPQKRRGRFLERVTLSNVIDGGSAQGRGTCRHPEKTLQTAPSGDLRKIRPLEIRARAVKMEIRYPDARRLVRGDTLHDLTVSEQKSTCVNGSLSGAVNRPGCPLRRQTIPVVSGKYHPGFSAARFSVSVAENRISTS